MTKPTAMIPGIPRASQGLPSSTEWLITFGSVAVALISLSNSKAAVQWPSMAEA